MNARDVLNVCDACGITLAAEGDRLRVRAPRGSLTETLRAGLAEHRATLLVWLGPMSETSRYIEEGERLYWRKRGAGLSHAQALADARREMGTFEEWKAARRAA